MSYEELKLLIDLAKEIGELQYRIKELQYRIKLLQLEEGAK